MKTKHMWTLALGLLFTLSLATVMYAQINRESGGVAPTLSCGLDELSRTREFVARADINNVGLFCGDNAYITLYECEGNSCETKTQVHEGYKVNGALPKFSGFDIGARYQYECFECPSTLDTCPITVTEGDLVEIEWLGSDPDAEIGPQGELTYEFDGIVGADGTWQTEKGDAGIHDITAAVFDGEFKDSTELCIEVLKANVAPKLTVPSTVSVAEGEEVSIDATCTDEDGDTTTISYDGWMVSATKDTDFDDEGEYEVSVTCADPDQEKDEATVLVTVTNTNRKPNLEVVEKITVAETETISLKPVCTDPDGDKTIIAITGFMVAETKDTTFGDAGQHDVDVECTDELGAEDKGDVLVEVLKTNRAPQISLESAVTVYEGETVRLRPRCSDPDNDQVSISYSGWMTSNAKVTDYSDAGSYAVTVTCDDGNSGQTVEDVTVNVLNRNRPPKIAWRQKA